MLADSSVHNLNLKGAAILKKDFTKIEELDAYIERRKNRMNQAVANNLDVNYDVCGIED